MGTDVSVNGLGCRGEAVPQKPSLKLLSLPLSSCLPPGHCTQALFCSLTPVLVSSMWLPLGFPQEGSVDLSSQGNVQQKVSTLTQQHAGPISPPTHSLLLSSGAVQAKLRLTSQASSACAHSSPILGFSSLALQLV